MARKSHFKGNPGRHANTPGAIPGEVMGKPGTNSPGSAPRKRHKKVKRGRA